MIFRIITLLVFFILFSIHEVRSSNGVSVDSLISKKKYKLAIKLINEKLFLLKDDNNSAEYGNLLLSLSKCCRAEHLFEESIKYSKDAMKIGERINSSEMLFDSYMLLGNSFSDLELLDSSTIYYNRALQYAEKSKEDQALIFNNLAPIYFYKDSIDKSLRSFRKARRLYVELNDIEYSNVAMLNEVSVLEMTDQLSKASSLLDTVILQSNLGKWDSNLEAAYYQKIQIWSKLNEDSEISVVVDSLNEIVHRLYNKDIADAESKYQNERLAAELLIEESNSQKRLFQLLALGSFFIIGILFSLYYIRNIRTKAQLQKATLELKRQQALTHERTRIASEMHDDLGGGLTTIKFLSQKALRKTKDETQKNDIQKIATNAQTLVGNMSEIIWAMNAGFDTVDNLVAYCRRYAREYLDDHELELKFRSEGVMDSHLVSGEKRRNVFLVVKESLHNIVKHAQADRVELNFAVDGALKVTVSDNGTGLPNEVSEFGNGLDNMRKRIESLGGQLEYLNDKGLTITISIPLDLE